MVVMAMPARNAAMIGIHKTLIPRQMSSGCIGIVKGLCGGCGMLLVSASVKIIFLLLFCG